MAAPLDDDGPQPAAGLQIEPVTAWRGRRRAQRRAPTASAGSADLLVDFGGCDARLAGDRRRRAGGHRHGARERRATRTSCWSPRDPRCPRPRSVPRAAWRTPCGARETTAARPRRSRARRWASRSMRGWDTAHLGRLASMGAHGPATTLRSRSAPTDPAAMVGRRPMSLQSALQEHFGFPAFRPGQEEAVAAAVDGPRRARRHADGRRQVALLPAARARARGPDAGRLAARLADAGPGRGAGAGAGRSLVNAQQDAATNAAAIEAARDGPRADALRRAGALRLARLPGARSRAASGCSSSTRRTASRSGATTSAPTTSGWPTPRATSAPEAIIASTATATPQVARDIEERLGLRRPGAGHHGLRPPEPDFAVVPCTTRQGQAPADRRGAAPSRARTPAIVYAGTRKGVDRLAETLSAELGCEVLGYHAGLGREPRADGPAAVHVRRGRRRGGDQRVRHGRRQGRRADGRPRDACPARWRPTTRRPAARAATARRRGRCCSPRGATRACTCSSSSAREVDDALIDRVAQALEFRGMDGPYDVELRELAADPDEEERLRAVIGHLAQAGVIAPTPAPVDRLRGRILSAVRRRGAGAHADAGRRGHAGALAPVPGDLGLRRGRALPPRDDPAPLRRRARRRSPHGPVLRRLQPGAGRGASRRGAAAARGTPATSTRRSSPPSTAANPACGRTRVVEILRGGRSQEAAGHSYDGLPGYGTLRPPDRRRGARARRRADHRRAAALDRRRLPQAGRCAAVTRRCVSVGVLASGSGTNLQALLDTSRTRSRSSPSRPTRPTPTRWPARARARGCPRAVFARGDFDDREARDLAMADWLAERGRRARRARRLHAAARARPSSRASPTGSSTSTRRCCRRSRGSTRSATRSPTA